MSNSEEELDDILNEIKNLKNSAPKDKDGNREKDGPPRRSAAKADSSEVKSAITAFESFDQPKEREKPDTKNDDTHNESEKEDIPQKVFEKEENKAKKLNKEDFIMPENNKGSNKKKIIIIAVAVIAVIAIAVGVGFAVKNSSKEPGITAPVTTTEAQTETQAPVSLENPLTGESDFNESAVGKRPIACVVENAAAARPQWGIDDSDNPPDIILEGEVEGGETRMLWFYADYTAVPSQIGPTRSARPPYIKFSELFDSIFLHWGMSKTKKGTDYIGANTVFRVDEVDHIDQMTYGGGVALFGRDSSRGVSTEHTGVIYGEKIAEAIEGEGFRTDADSSKYSKFNFAEDVAFDTDCQSLGVTFSSRTATRNWTYDSEDGMYHCSDYSTDVTRKNILVLFDTTEYISKANYKNSGSAEIYCNYNLAGGEGKLACNGTVEDITWSVENGLLVLKDSAGNDLSLNVGTTWIGYASANNGGAAS